MRQVYIVTEHPQNGLLLKRLLSGQFGEQLFFLRAESAYDAESRASSILASKRQPVVLILDAKTHDAEMIQERLQDLNFLMRMAAAGTPFKVLLVEPDLSVLFFQDREMLESLVAKPLTDLEWRLAQQSPELFLEMLPGGKTGFWEARLRDLTEEQVRVLGQHSVVQGVREFLGSLVVAAA
jgi:hypothetical protein